jgi:small nuclear ribonucleoprotein (snRNP)-like protein
MIRLFRRYPELRTVIVNLRSGTAFKAVVWRHDGPYLVLRNAEMLSDRDTAARKTVDGEVLVKVADVDFLQVVA